MGIRQNDTNKAMFVMLYPPHDAFPLIQFQAKINLFLVKAVIIEEVEWK